MSCQCELLERHRGFRLREWFGMAAMLFGLTGGCKR